MDAWEIAKKIVITPTDKLEEIFLCSTIQEVFERYTADEAFEIIKKQYEPKLKQYREDEVERNKHPVKSLLPSYMKWVLVDTRDEFKDCWGKT